MQRRQSGQNPGYLVNRKGRWGGRGETALLVNRKEIAPLPLNIRSFPSPGSRARRKLHNWIGILHTCRNGDGEWRDGSTRKD